ncbi:hypothetical protein E4U13_002901 [Claviceps humidiphila]|uniref:Phosphatidic acid phosphatase type 2/haloperoxidase domain-containing protein n=1 Tax=Claviceps humidiphila TaxID=1294629 RepID=A0A9P7PZG5_9HYPO|nr:hypothetical protein E4U13_002901 [Claviceps humidiphila]
MSHVLEDDSRNLNSGGLALPTNSSSSSSSSSRGCQSFLGEWFRLNFRNLLTMLIVAGLSLFIFYVPIKVVRTFPLTFNGSGDIIYPQWAYPDRGWILESYQAGLISICVPAIFILLAQIRIRSAWDASTAIMGTTWALLMGSLFQVLIKQFIGGFRPYFLAVCMPDISLAENGNRSGLDGVGFQNIMYTTDICTQPDKFKLQNAVTSFPSGHSTVAFAGFGFLFLWLNGKLKVWADYRPAFWKVALTMLPLLIAAMIACSLTIDAAHNWYDIVAGSVIGTMMAFASYRSHYAAVFDWRFNHVPLQERESFAYDSEEDYGMAAHTFTRRVRWGTSRRWLDQQHASAGSSALFSHNPGKFPRGGSGRPVEGSRPKRLPSVGQQSV